MSQSQARKGVLEAFGAGNGAVSPEGGCKAQEKRGSTYAALPAEVVDALDVEQGDNLVRGYHAPTQTVLIAVKSEVDPESNHWAADFV